MKRLTILIIIFALILTLFNCTPPDGDPEPSQMTQYGWGVYLLVSFATLFPDPAIAIDTVGDVTTYTFTSYAYMDPDDPDAEVSGTHVETDDGITMTVVSNLTFINDDIGLDSISADYSGPSGGQADSGTITVNGDEWPITDFIAFING